jgi:hypothetical protein
MTTVTVNIPDKEKSNLSSFVKERGGEIVDIKETDDQIDNSETEEDNDVTHGEFFGENIRRAINTLKSC